ncbi:MAG: DNA alkylation repair protein [candidate division Zixibacteria bacterium]|nr:DNA alkylation repair protein [candidate division Zixibacteria bacterium]
MPKSKSEIYNSLYSKLKQYASPEHAKRSKGVLNSNHQLLGVPVPVLKQMASDFKKDVQGIFDFDDVCRLCSRLWRGRYHEQRELALIILEKYARFFDDQTWDMLNEWIDNADAWDLIDRISVSLLGRMLAKDLKRIDELEDWTKSDNFWRRRTAAATCVALMHGKNSFPDESLKVCVHLLDDQELMVQKAVAWLLREVSEKTPEKTFELMMKHKKKIPRFILREGSKKLSDLQKMELLVK